MSLSSKDIFKTQFRPLVEPEGLRPLSLDALYRLFKQHLNEFRTHLDTTVTVLGEDLSVSIPKAKLLAVVRELYSRPESLELVFSKGLDERLWSAIEAETRRGGEEQEALDSSGLKDLLRLLDKEKQVLASCLKTAWEGFRPLDELNLPDSQARKVCSRMLQAIGEVVSFKAKHERGLLPEAKDLLMRSQRLYSYSGRTAQLLGTCHKQLADVFGGIYWVSMALATVEPASDMESLIRLYDDLNAAWLQFTSQRLQTAHPRWYIGFCLSFLKIQGGFLMGQCSSTSDFTLKTCLDNMKLFIGSFNESEGNANILQIHVSLRNVEGLPQLVAHNWRLFEGGLPVETTRVIEYFSQFVLALLREINNGKMFWVSSILTFLYWVSSYTDLKQVFASPLFTEGLSKLKSLILAQIDPAEFIDEQLCLPEDLRNIGFLPLHFYMLDRKTLSQDLVPPTLQMKYRLATTLKLIERLLEDNKEPETDELGFLSFHEEELSGLFIQSPAKEFVVIDGPNVAIRHGNGKFSSKGIQLAIDHFRGQGYSCVAVVPEQYLNPERAQEMKVKGISPVKYAIDIHTLTALDDSGYLIKTPPQDYDDAYCIQFAKQKKGVILSNDRYWDFVKKNPADKGWLRAHVCSFTFGGDTFLPNPGFLFKQG